MGMVGADPDELDRIASELKSRAGALAGFGTELGRQLRGTSWQGARADRFRSDWSRTHATAIRSASSFLRSAAVDLARHAAEQRQASSAAGAPGDTAFPRPPGVAAPLPGDGGDIDALMRSRIVKTEHTFEVDLDLFLPVGIPLWIGIDSEAIYRTFADGHIEVTLEGSALAGLFAMLRSGQGKLNGGIGDTGSVALSFANWAEFRRFIHDLKNLVRDTIPTAAGGLGGPIGLAVAYKLNSRGRSAMERFAKEYGDNVTSLKFGYKGEAGLGLDGGMLGELDAEVRRSAKIDLVDRTFEITTDGSLGGSLGSAHGSVQMSATLDVPINGDGSPTMLTIEGAGASGVDLLRVLGVPTDAVSFTSDTTEMRFSASIDLSDPLLASAALRLMNELHHGPIETGMDALALLVDRSTLQVQLMTNVSASGGVELGLASGGGSSNNPTAVTTFVKVPGGDLHAYRG